MEQAHPTGCLTFLNSELRFERDKNRFQKARPMGRDPPPPPVTSQSIQYLRLRQSRGGGEGGEYTVEGLRGSQES